MDEEEQKSSSILSSVWKLIPSGKEILQKVTPSTCSEPEKSILEPVPPVKNITAFLQQPSDLTAEAVERKKQWENARSKHEEILNANPHHKIFTFGSMKDFHQGIGSLLGQPQKLVFEAMEKEHCNSQDSDVTFFSHNYHMETTPRVEWNFVTNPTAENLESLCIEHWPVEKSVCPYPRKPTPLDSLEKTLREYNDKLAKIGVPEMTLIEVIACRLHTGPMGPKYNKILRSNGKNSEGNNTYATTIHVLQSAISKLGKINPNRFLYSGIGDLLLPECAWNADSILSTKGGAMSGLMGMTQSLDVAKQYAMRDSDKVGLIIKVDMATMDRGADITQISQYPHEKETLLPPLTFLHIEHVQHIQLDVANSANTSTGTGTGTGTRESTRQMDVWVVEARSRISPSIQVEKPLLTEDEMMSIREASTSDFQTVSTRRTQDLVSRFTGVENYLITGNPMKSVRGLPYFLGVDETKLQKSMKKGSSKGLQGLSGMREEIMRSGNEVVIQNMKYVFDEEASEKRMPNGHIRDKGNTGRRLKYFANLDQAAKVGLTIAHVASLRLYTTPAFEFINNPLRNPNEDQDSDNNENSQKPHPFPVTVSLIDEGLKKLRLLNAAKIEKYPTLWRGYKHMKIPDAFIENRRGGTELGLMSTSDDLAVAVEYSKSSQGCSLLFKIRIENLKQCGADISWLSTVGSEREILYPPLTFLQPTGRVQTVTAQGLFFTVVELQPHI